MFDDAPNEFETLFQRPGRTWTTAEKNALAIWLNTGQRLEEARTRTRQLLGPTGNWQDAENAWNAFFTHVRRDGKTTYDHLVDVYDPKYRKAADQLKPESPRFFAQSAADPEPTMLPDEHTDEIQAEPGTPEKQPFAALVAWALRFYCKQYVRDHFNRRAKLQEKLAALPPPSPAMPSAPVAEDELADCVGRLSEPYRTVIQEYYFEHKLGREIATEQDISVRLVKLRLHLARNQLRKCLENKGIGI